MKTFKQQAFEELVSSVYEDKPNSSLFARYAYSLMKNGNSADAVDVLRKGLKLYPDYPTPYFILAKALTRLGYFDQALKSAKRGSELLGSDSIFNLYAKEIIELREFAASQPAETIIPQESSNKAQIIFERKVTPPEEPAEELHDESKDDSTVVDDEMIEVDAAYKEFMHIQADEELAKQDVVPEQEEKELSEVLGINTFELGSEADFITNLEYENNSDNTQSNTVAQNNELDQQLLEMTREISRAKALFVDYSDADASYDDVSSLLGDDMNYVSEHLAETYIKRGDYNRAIDIYQILLKREPQSKTYFEKKIFEIKTVMSSSR